MIHWIPAKIIKISYYNNNSFLKILLKASINKFIPGQFGKILIKNKEKNVQRAYSFANPPSEKKIEFLITLLKSGKMSKFLKKITLKNKIYISKSSFGYFTLNEIKKPFKNLWMISTGTGISPYLSILKQKENKLKNFNKIILIQSVRYYSDLIYLSDLKDLKKKFNKKLIIKIIISREKKIGFLNNRITELFKKNFFEKKLKITLNNKNSHFMLCGNPNMVSEMQNWLIFIKKMKKNFKKKPGNITIEKYW